MGTSHQPKEWDVDKWIELIHLLHEKKFTVVLTGLGAREQINCNRVSSATGCYNYCNQLEWPDFAHVIQHAKAMISVDTAAVHLAAAVQTPSVILFAGINSPHMWVPPYPLCKVLMHRVRYPSSRIGEIQAADVIRSLESIYIF
jgi:heptosyltransferase-3